MDLTEAGRVFYADATVILAEVDAAKARVRALAEGWSGLLRIGFSGSASYRQLPEVARLVQRFLPQVELDTVSEMLTPEQEQALAENRLDLGILRPPVRVPGIVARTIASEPLVLAVPARHRLSRLEGVRVEDLAGEVLLTYPGSRSVVAAHVTDVLRRTGTVVGRSREVPQTSSMVALVAAGIGVALVPDSVRALTMEGVEYRPVLDAGTVDLALAWREDEASPLTVRFRDLLLTHLTGAPATTHAV
ncbi:LysR substrate-binding domain-containing protein [Georgenia yuyongxinii]